MAREKGVKRTKRIAEAFIDNDTGEVSIMEFSICVNAKYDGDVDAYVCNCYKCRKRGIK